MHIISIEINIKIPNVLEILQTIVASPHRMSLSSPTDDDGTNQAHKCLR